MLEWRRHRPGRRRRSLVNTPSSRTHGHFAWRRLARATSMDGEKSEFTFGWWFNKNYSLSKWAIFDAVRSKHDKIFPRSLPDYSQKGMNHSIDSFDSIARFHTNCMMQIHIYTNLNISIQPTLPTNTFLVHTNSERAKREKVCHLRDSFTYNMVR